MFEYVLTSMTFDLKNTRRYFKSPFIYKYNWVEISLKQAFNKPGEEFETKLFIALIPEIIFFCFIHYYNFFSIG